MAEDHTTTQEATLEAAHTTTEGQTPGHTPIIGVPVVARRIERRTT